MAGFCIKAGFCVVRKGFMLTAGFCVKVGFCI